MPQFRVASSYKVTLRDAEDHVFRPIQSSPQNSQSEELTIFQSLSAKVGVP